MKKFLNVSNHPTSKWGEEQLSAVKRLGADVVVDLEFPNVNPNCGTVELGVMALNLYSLITSHLENCDKITVHIMGELGLTCYVVEMLKRDPRITLIHSTTERVVEEKDGAKISHFKFVRFREYV